MLLGDVGGFSGLLYAVGASIIGVVTYQKADNHLVNRLFVVNKKAKSTLINMG